MEVALGKVDNRGEAAVAREVGKTPRTVVEGQVVRLDPLKEGRGEGGAIVNLIRGVSGSRAVPGLMMTFKIP